MFSLIFNLYSHRQSDGASPRMTKCKAKQERDKARVHYFSDAITFVFIDLPSCNTLHITPAKLRILLERILNFANANLIKINKFNCLFIVVLVAMHT